MSTGAEARAKPDDLCRIEGKAELIGGRIVRLMPTGRKPNRVAFRICKSLDEYSERTGRWEAYTNNIGFIVSELASGRESFSPDASWFEGPFPANPMRLLEGALPFAVEVRSEGDYGPAAEVEMAGKRSDYFEAGTLVVWDVDPRAECVHVYQAADSGQPVTFHRGETADAEPAVRGWRMAVDSIFQ